MLKRNIVGTTLLLALPVFGILYSALRLSTNGTDPGLKNIPAQFVLISGLCILSCAVAIFRKDLFGAGRQRMRAVVFAPFLIRIAETVYLMGINEKIPTWLKGTNIFFSIAYNGSFYAGLCAEGGVMAELTHPFLEEHLVKKVQYPFGAAMTCFLLVRSYWTAVNELPLLANKRLFWPSFMVMIICAPAALFLAGRSLIRGRNYPWWCYSVFFIAAIVNCNLENKKFHSFLNGLVDSYLSQNLSIGQLYVFVGAAAWASFALDGKVKWAGRLFRSVEEPKEEASSEEFAKW